MVAATSPANTLESESICRCLYLSCEVWVWVLQHCSTAALQHCSLPNITLSDSDALWPRRELCTQLNISALVYRLGTGYCDTEAGNKLTRNPHLGHLFSVQKQVKVPSWSSQVPPSWQGEEEHPSWPRSSIVNT